MSLRRQRGYLHIDSMGAHTAFCMCCTSISLSCHDMPYGIKQSILVQNSTTQLPTSGGKYKSVLPGITTALDFIPLNAARKSPLYTSLSEMSAFIHVHSMAR